MPVSELRETASLTRADLLDFAVSADQEARRLRKLGNADWRKWDAESARLCALYRERK